MTKKIPSRNFITLSKSDEDYFIEEIRCDNGEVYEDTIDKIRTHLGLELVNNKLYDILWNEEWNDGEPEYIMKGLKKYQTQDFYKPIMRELEIMYLWCEIVCGYYDDMI